MFLVQPQCNTLENPSHDKIYRSFATIPPSALYENSISIFLSSGCFPSPSLAIGNFAFLQSHGRIFQRYLFLPPFLTPDLSVGRVGVVRRRALLLHNQSLYCCSSATHHGSRLSTVPNFVLFIASNIDLKFGSSVPKKSIKIQPGDLFLSWRIWSTTFLKSELNSLRSRYWSPSSTYACDRRFAIHNASGIAEKETSVAHSSEGRLTCICSNNFRETARRSLKTYSYHENET